MFGGFFTQICQVATIDLCNEPLCVQALDGFNDFGVGILVDLYALKCAVEVIANEHIQFMHLFW